MENSSQKPKDESYSKSLSLSSDPGLNNQDAKSNIEISSVSPVGENEGGNSDKEENKVQTGEDTFSTNHMEAEETAQVSTGSGKKQTDRILILGLIILTTSLLISLFMLFFR